MNEVKGITDRLKERAAEQVRTRIAELTREFSRALSDCVGGNSVKVLATFDEKQVVVRAHYYQALSGLERALFDAWISRAEENMITEFLQRVRHMSDTVAELENKPKPRL